LRNGYRAKTCHQCLAVDVIVVRHVEILYSVGDMLNLMRSQPLDMVEGPRALERFKTAIRKIIAVPRAEILRREEEYKRQAMLNPRKRGPKPKQKSASRVPADDA
jgi:hypothetical protein